MKPGKFLGNPQGLLPCALVALMLMLACITGCDTTVLTRGPVPAGPGVTTSTDLSPWLIDSPTVAYVGTLDHFLVYSQTGIYPTWSLVPSGRHVGSELDIRACAAGAEQLRGRKVLIHGKLIERRRHLPLLVAQHIAAYDAEPSAPPFIIADGSARP